MEMKEEVKANTTSHIRGVVSACVSSVANENDRRIPSLVVLRYCNKHLLSERHSSMKIPLARQGVWSMGGGWLVVVVGVCLIMHKI